jgi:thiol-disulfide isomerase/thioredoxin
MIYKSLGVFLIAAVLGIILARARPWASQGPAETLESGARAGELANAAETSEFPEKTQWLQSKPLPLASLRGKVVVLHFWTFGCINCQRNYPVYKAWQKKYADTDVTIIGVHTPEFDHEADVDRVRAKARDNGLQFPIAIDNDHRIWKSWKNEYWPSIYLVDKKGRVRYHWDGELDPQSPKGKQFASRIDELRAEKS